MNTDPYETSGAKPGKDLKADLKRALSQLGFTAIYIRDTKNALDKIRWQVDCLDQSGDAMIIHGVSFMMACIAKGMEITFREGCVWHASTPDVAIKKRERVLKPMIPIPAGKPMDVVPWDWESNDSRARHCAEFLRTHKIISPHEYEVALNRISRMGKSDD